jgi:hypothetical protein
MWIWRSRSIAVSSHNQSFPLSPAFFLALLISLLPNLGVRAVNVLALVAMVFVALYIFIVRAVGAISLYAIPKSLWLGFFFLTPPLW